ncbi:Leucine aminopeptidase 1 [Phlyctochytrium bullatum]|nr:Leucine aminopeptidase 1 [Phlyctochytrium bullatum]
MRVSAILASAVFLCLGPAAEAFRPPHSGLEARDKPAGVESLLAPTKGPASGVAIPTKPQFTSVVFPLIQNIDVAKTKNWLIRMTQFPERYYTSQNGIAAANWIKDQVSALTAPAGAKLTVSLFNHSWNAQPSVIARYEPVTPSSLTGIIITGSHLDTLGKGSGKPEPNAQPGADDCASGSSIVFESLRVMTASGFIPARPIEFHWYSGEELGILGSNEVAEDYAKKGIKVVSYLNLDQSGYTKPGKTARLGVFTDYTTTAPTAFIKQTISTYTTLGFTESKCGYKCTDNSAWYDHGYEVGFAAEAVFSDSFPYSDQVNSDGSALDVVANINFTHITEFVKNTLGYTVELSLAGSQQPPVSSSTAVSTTKTTTVSTSTTAAPAITPATITVAPSLKVVVVTKTPTTPVTPAPPVSGTTTVRVTVPASFDVSVVTKAALARRAAVAGTTTVSVTVGPSVSLSVATAAALERRGGGSPTTTTSTPAPTPTTTSVPPTKTAIAFTVAPTLKLDIVNA